MMGRRKDGTLFSLRIAITESVVCENTEVCCGLLERNNMGYSRILACVSCLIRRGSATSRHSR
jgi:hypothetical protein